MKNVLKAGLLSVLVGCLSGCMDGPFYAVKRINPYFTAQWRDDQKLGPTFDDRMDELKLLEGKIESMAASDQAEWAVRLEKLVREDPSPEIRARAVRVIATVPGEAAERALNTASADDVDKVRMAACKSWARRGSDAGKDMLLSLAAADASNSVRQSAVEGLANYDDPEVVRALGGLLEDRSPAILYQVTQSLAQLTGEDYGGDIEQWNTVIAQYSPPAATPSETEQNEVQTASGFDFPELPNIR